MNDQTTPEPLTDDDLTEIRMHNRAYATDPSDAPILVEADTDRRLLLAEVDRLRAEVARLRSRTEALATEAQFQGRRADEARAKYDAEEVIVDGNVFRRGNLPTILADSMNSGAEHAREAKRLASQIDRLADWLTEHTDEPKDSYGAVEAAINAIEERDAQLNEASAAAWEQGYALGVNDERTAESNIGIAGFGMKVSPARENPYRAAERVEPRHFTPYGAVTTACGKAIPPDSPWEPSRGDWELATLTTRRASTTCQSCINRFDSESAGLDSPAPLTLAQAATALHDWARDLDDGTRTDWPAGHPDIIHGIRAAADWLDARAAYETETREQHLTAVREAGKRLGESFQHLGEAIRDGAAKARAAREQTAAEMPDVDGWTIYPTTDGGLMVSHDTDADRPVLAADDSIPLAAVLAFIADADDATEGDPK